MDYQRKIKNHGRMFGFGQLWKMQPWSFLLCSGTAWKKYRVPSRYHHYGLNCHAFYCCWAVSWTRHHVTCLTQVIWFQFQFLNQHTKKAKHCFFHLRVGATPFLSKLGVVIAMGLQPRPSSLRSQNVVNIQAWVPLPRRSVSEHLAQMLIGYIHLD